MTKLKRCSLCRQEVPWLIRHALSPADQVVVSLIERAVPLGSSEDGICLPCFERYKRERLSGCCDIRVHMN